MRTRVPLPAAALLLLVACVPGKPSPPDGPDERERQQTGYGTERRATSTGAVSSLEGDALPDRSGASLPELLDRVPGVDVTRRGATDFSVRIRGTRSLGMSNEPLFVVDGVPRNAEALEAVIPSSIVRIDVLKDAATLAAYGARGANGVILITTLDAP